MQIPRDILGKPHYLYFINTSQILPREFINGFPNGNIMKRLSTGCVFYCFQCQLLHTSMILWLYIEKEIVHLRENTNTHIRFNERKKDKEKK